MKTGFPTAFVLALLLPLGVAGAAVPDADGEIVRAPPPRTEVGTRQPPVQVAQDFVPLERVLASLRRKYSGHHLSVSGPTRMQGGYVYRIKWLTDEGAVLYIVADAQSGAIVSVEGG